MNMMTVAWIFHLLALLTVASSHEDCGMEDPTETAMQRAQLAEVKMFGKTVADMDLLEISSIASNLFSKTQSGATGTSQDSPEYTLRGLPIVWHVLPNQDNRGTGSPSITEAQVNFTTMMTNRFYTIYDKTSQTSVEWANFVVDEIIYHEDINFPFDCGFLTPLQYSRIVTKASEWQFKLHNIVWYVLNRVSSSL